MCITTTVQRLLQSAGLAAAVTLASGASAQSAFTYQGVLEESGSPVTGLENIRFRLFDAPAGGSLLGETTQNVDVEAGVFTTQLNFGPLSTVDFADAWLEIAVNTGSGFETLGRQQITATPYALNTRGIEVDSVGNVSTGAFGVNLPHVFDITGRDAFLRIIGESVGGGGVSSMELQEVPVGGGAPVSTWRFRQQAVAGPDNGDMTVDIVNGANPGGKLVMTYGVDGNIGIGTGSPEEALQVGSFLTNEDQFIQVSTNGGNNFRSGLRLSHFASDNGFEIFSDERGSGPRGLHFTDLTGATTTTPMFIQADSGRVGVGTTAPQGALTITGNNSLVDLTQQGVHIGQIPFANGSGASVNLVGGSEGAQYRFFDTAQAGASARLWYFPATKEIRIDGAASFLDGFRVRTDLLVEGSAFKPGGGSWSNLSDRNLKKNIAELDGALDTILALKGVTYEYKDSEAINELPGTRTGFIAQDVEQVIPDWVDEGEDGNKRLTIRGFEAIAVEAIRELKAEKDAEIADLRSQIESMQAQRSVVGASMVWPVLLGGGVLGGLAVARRRMTKA